MDRGIWLLGFGTWAQVEFTGSIFLLKIELLHIKMTIPIGNRAC